jgi:hypothetical protein
VSHWTIETVVAFQQPTMKLCGDCESYVALRAIYQNHRNIHASPFPILWYTLGMPNSNYISGRNAEYSVCKALKEQGAVFAQRTAGSHSPIDIVALFPDGTCKLVQVKADSSPLHLQELAALPHAENVSLELWHRVDGKWVIYH